MKVALSRTDDVVRPRLVTSALRVRKTRQADPWRLCLPSRDMSLSSLRLVTWNCRSGSVARRVSQLAEYRPDLVFLQECDPTVERTPCVVCITAINSRKAIAIATPSASCRCQPRPLARGSGRAAVAVDVLVPQSLTVLGIWARGPNYAQDVLRTLDAHAHLLRARTAIVMGDFNSGTKMVGRKILTRHHHLVLDRCVELGLASAYHLFNNTAHARELDATYFHLFRRREPWHIDFCLVPFSWRARLRHVAVLRGRKWSQTSDHRPLLVELDAELHGGCA